MRSARPSSSWRHHEHQEEASARADGEDGHELSGRVALVANTTRTAPRAGATTGAEEVTSKFKSIDLTTPADIAKGIDEATNAAVALRSTKLKDETIISLIAHDAKLSYATVAKVINAMTNLRKNHLK